MVKVGIEGIHGAPTSTSIRVLPSLERCLVNEVGSPDVTAIHTEVEVTETHGDIPHGCSARSPIPVGETRGFLDTLSRSSIPRIVSQIERTLPYTGRPLVS